MSQRVKFGNTPEQTLREIRKSPILSEVDEREAVRLWQEEQVEDARLLVIFSALRAGWPYYKKALRFDSGVGDLIQDLTVILMHALDKFEPARGFRFYTYARHWVRLAADEFFFAARTWPVPLPLHHGTQGFMERKREIFNDIDTTDPEAARKLWAKRLGMSPATFRQVESHMRNLYAESLDRPVTGYNDTESGTLTFGDTLTDDSDAEGDFLIRDEQEQQLGFLKEAITTLPPKWQQVMQARFFSGGMDLPAYVDIAATMNLTGQRVRQIEMAAVAKLQAKVRQAKLQAELHDRSRITA